ncbi:Acg family FMN-binding oxidoreductase [Aldersonia kunmingensis]|uniref:Acg family FMN-binding oxidoreductase n=1 Tax=Aldersonia kunmingensis TaxID=408066 RepID=UPI000A7379AA|nr:NAD(P)H nitroreductase [Aldersonia kunmingensis]
MNTNSLMPPAPDMIAGPTPETVRAAVALACRAPSLHNTQPWKWVFDGVVLHLYSDPARLLPETDPFGRQLLLSCGAVLDHLKVALAVRGWRALVVRFPDPTRLDHLAAITFTPARFVTMAEHFLAEAIERRRTDRSPLSPPADWADFEPRITELLEDYAATATFLTQDSRGDLAQASRMTAARRRYDSMYRAELRWWTGHSTQVDGVPASVLATSGDSARVPLGRTFPAGQTISAESAPEIDASALVVLGTEGDHPLDCLRCGEALSAVLLEATVAGYATCTLTHLTELPASRAVVAQLAPECGVPQVVIRVGAAANEPSDRPRTARRDVDSVFAMRPQTARAY